MAMLDCKYSGEAVTLQVYGLVSTMLGPLPPRPKVVETICWMRRTIRLEVKEAKGDENQEHAQRRRGDTLEGANP